MFSAFLNCFRIPELRDRIIFTLLLLFVARIGANIPLPGLDPTPLQDFFEDQRRAGGNSLVGLYNMFTGGALLKGAVFALGVMPYISASIIFQLMGAVFPSLARLQQEGEVGRQKLNQYTRYATVVICLVQGVLMILALQNPGNLFPGYQIEVYGNIVLMDGTAFLVTSTLLLTCGTLILMWLGEQITQRGIGNGMSLLITIGIVADLPGAVTTLGSLIMAPVGAEESLLRGPMLLVMLVVLLVVTAGIVALTQATRKIPVQYAKRMVGRKVYGGQSSFLPLKVNYSGVMPVIFASAILMFFQQIASWLGAYTGWGPLQEAGAWFGGGHSIYYITLSLLIFSFSYFWVSLMFKPLQIADDLKKYGGFVPGVRPGEPTAKFLDFVMTRLTLAGAIALVGLVLLPDLLGQVLRLPWTVTQFFGGTGMLIIVGVLLDTLRQVETYLLQRHYDGFLKKGRIKGRTTDTGRGRQLVEASQFAKLRRPAIIGACMFVSGFLAFILEHYVL